MAEFTIGDIAREFGVTMRALRFYEDRGLLAPKRRGIHRVYDSRDRARLSVILKGKQLGFSLSEIVAMVRASSSPEAGPEGLPLSHSQIDDQIVHLERQLIETQTAITELRRERERLLEAQAASAA